jgi:hypothetical protein
MGKLPLTTVQEYTAVPPLAPRVVEYCRPTAPLGKGDGVVMETGAFVAMMNAGRAVP